MTLGDTKGHERDVLSSLLRELRRFEHDSWRRYPEEEYAYNGSSIRSYEGQFETVMEPDTIVAMMSRIPMPVVIDLMAPPDTVMSLFRRLDAPGNLGVSVRFSDDPYERSYEHWNVTEIGGDLLRRKTWKDIQKALDDRKANLIMERAKAGFNNLPRSKEFYAIMLNRAWQLLEPSGGTLLFELPQLGLFDSEHFNIPSVNDVKKWIDLLRENGINVRSFPSHPDSSIEDTTEIRITRQPSNPQTLPFAIN